MKKVLIMGGAGFIGFNIAKFLQQKNGYAIRKNGWLLIRIY